MPLSIRVPALLPLALGAALLSGCSDKPPSVASSKLRVYAVDLAGGAKACESPKVSPTAGKPVPVALKVGNDGGWCGVTVAQDGPKPFDAGLLAGRPEHGTVVIHSVGDYTRIDYTPDKGFAGSDAFTVKLLPGAAVLDVAVTVTTPAASS